MTNDEYLLMKACQFALNSIHNSRLNHPIYNSTYVLANAVDKAINAHEEEMNSKSWKDGNIMHSPEPNTKLHPCPYQSEINNNDQDFCDCDDDAMRECLMDI
jgi:hypothetical protein